MDNPIVIYDPGAAGFNKRRKRSFVPGRDRVGGYYGRYAVGGRGGELKFLDLDLDDATVAAGAVIQAGGTINVIEQGVTESQRVGRKCTIKSINWRYQVRIPEYDDQANPDPGDTVRVILYLDKQCNGATAANTDILESADFQSFRNLANSGRFVILHDKVFSMNHFGVGSATAGNLSTGEVVKNATFFKKCNIPIEFNNTTGAIAEIRSNNLGVLICGQSGVAGFNSKIRLRFSDM